MTNDPVQHPKHYTYAGIEVLDIIEAYKLDFFLGNVIKYVLRAPHKNGLEDYRKAKFYLDRHISLLEKQNDSQTKAQASEAISENK